MPPIVTFQLSPLNHKWSICGLMVMTAVMAWWEDQHCSVCIHKQLSENPAFFLAPSKCKCYSNIYSLTLMISRRMLDVPTPLSNHLLLIVTFQSSLLSNCKWTICGATVTTVAGWTCGAGNKQPTVWCVQEKYRRNQINLKRNEET
jgi:hypothetical protein